MKNDLGYYTHYNDNGYNDHGYIEFTVTANKNVNP